MTPNLFANPPSNLPDELFTTLLEATNLRIERIVSHGHSSPEGFWYDQDQHEWVLVLQRAARLSNEGQTRELKPGDYINIAAHQKHRDGEIRLLDASPGWTQGNAEAVVDVTTGRARTGPPTGNSRPR